MKKTNKDLEPYRPLIVIGITKLMTVLKPRFRRAAKTIRLLASKTPQRIIRLLKFIRRQPLLLYSFLVVWLVVFVQGERALFRPFYPFPIVRDDMIGSGNVGVHYGTYFCSTLLLVGALILVVVNAVAIRRRGNWRMFSGIANGVTVAVIAVIFQSYTLYYKNFTSAATLSVAKPPTLKQAIVQRAQCGDAVQFVNNYGYDTKTFYDLQHAGWHLAANYTSDNGNLNTYAACKVYFSLREHYASDKIIAQLYREDDGKQLPFYYQDSQSAVMLGLKYGLFVKD